MEIFNNGDEEYFKWMDQNPSGFILNTTKGKNTSYFVLHQSLCTHITEYEELRDGAYTQKTYIKIASIEVSEIIAYCFQNKKNFKGEFHLCKTCKPTYLISEIVYPDDLPGEQEVFLEGGKKTIIVNSFERNSKARQKCIDHYGYTCQGCSINFEKVYGKIGKNFIHVHHLKLIAEIGEEYQIDPVKDLIPLCPNCHAMAHKRVPPFTIQELKETMVH